MLKPSYRGEHRAQGWCVCCFEVQRNAPKMSSKNGRKQNEKAQKAKNREEKGSVNDFIGLLIPAPFFFEGYASENYHWRENPQKMPSNQRKDTSNLTVARYLFPVVSCGHFTSYRSHKYTLREKGVKQAVCACTFACDFLLFPLISSVLGTRICSHTFAPKREKRQLKTILI